MPTISVNKRLLAEKLNTEISDELLDENLFSFGLELDDIVNEDGETFYKIEIPANRYDLLCLEGLVYALNPFNNKEKFTDIKVEEGSYIVIQENNEHRPFIACAVVNDINFDQNMYDSFIDYQDKLHSSIGRNRSIVAIGTHDLETIEFPVFYKAEEPSNVNFAPLNQEKRMSGNEISKFYANDTKMKNYVKLLKDRYPIFVDSKDDILSLPPLINSNKTKISMQTKSVFVEVTGTDLNKVNIALKMILYCFRGKSVTQVEIKQKEEMHGSKHKKNDCKHTEYKNKDCMNTEYKNKEAEDSHERKSYENNMEKALEQSVKNMNISSKNKRFTPEFNNYTYIFDLFEIQDELGIRLSHDQIKILLEKMMHSVTIKDDKMIVKVSDVRSDILHKVDIIEDVAIAYGYNNFTRSNPKIYTIGEELPINKLCNRLREEIAQMGYNEVLTLSLHSKKEIIGQDGNIILDNPKSSECEVLRNMLLPGILKTIHANQHTGVPMKVFEISDCVDFNGKNKRKLCICFANMVDGLDFVIGTCSMILLKMGLCFRYVEKQFKFYFDMRSCEILVGDTVVGTLGVIHCDLCTTFRIPFAVSSFEIDMDTLFKLYTNQ